MKAFRSEFKRLASFAQWPDNVPVRPMSLAPAGFFYCGKNGSDEVTCFSCGCRISGWGPDSNPSEKHRQVSPKCAFMRDGSGDEPMENPLNLETLEDCLAALGHKNELKTFSADNLLSVTTRTSDGHDDDYVVTEHGHPTTAFFEEMRSEVKRQSTFYDWTFSHIQPLTQLASAGFFYTGEADRTQCAFCHGILRNWHSGDVPMDEHRRHFPRCPLVLGLETNTLPAFSSIPSRPISGSLPQHQPLSHKILGYVSHSDILRRQSKARMDTEMVKTVVNMGYPQETVRQVIEDRLASTGDDFPSALSLVEALLEIENEMNSGRDHLPVSGGHGTAQTSAPMEDEDQNPHEVVKTEATSNPADEESSMKSKKSRNRKRNKNKKKNSGPPQGSPVPEELSSAEDQEVHEKPSPNKRSHHHTSKEYQ